jgi:RNA polymerase sigma-70 factor (ECF subfamily)
LLDRTISEDVQRALAAVPTDFRTAVILCDVEGFSYKEIAEIMECPVGTVMSRLHRGRRLLRQALADFAREQGLLRDGPADASSASTATRGEHDVIPLDRFRTR